MNNQKEVWKDVSGYEGVYQISNTGRVKSLKRIIIGRWDSRQLLNERILKPSTFRGYKRVLLLKNKIRTNFIVHRLVAIAFIGNPEKKSQVNHKNGIKNDNSVSNLEWCTPSENTKHAYDLGLAKPPLKGVYGKNNPLSIPIKQLSKVGVFIKLHYGINQAGRDLCIDVSTIVNALKGNRKTAGGFKWEYEKRY